MNPVKTLLGLTFLAALASAQPGSTQTTVPPQPASNKPAGSLLGSAQPGPGQNTVLAQPAPAKPVVAPSVTAQPVLTQTTVPAQTVPAQAVPARPGPAAVASAPAPAPARLAPPPVEVVPVPPPNVIFRPTFLTADIAHYTGMAFRVRSEATSQHYLVTCHSLFSPTFGLDVQMTADDIARVIVAAVGVSCTDRSVVVLAKPYIYVPDARPADRNGNGAEKDLALFYLPTRGDEPALRLDPAPPIVGDRVWIYVKYAGTAKVGLEGATIAWKSEKEIRYLLDNQNADLRLVNGAPILSADSDVVGIHIGTFTSKLGRIFGYACPASSIRALIEPAKRPPKSLLR
jgi:hypothetical protein